jgi:hypothetical protein
VPRLIVARLLLICAVLLAQQTALAHDFWHASGAAAQGDGKPAKGKSLCDLHDLLGTVLGAVSAAPPQADLLSLSDIGFIADPVHAAQRRALAAQSRGPPALS